MGLKYTKNIIKYKSEKNTVSKFDSENSKLFIEIYKNSKNKSSKKSLEIDYKDIDYVAVYRTFELAKGKKKHATEINIFRLSISYKKKEYIIQEFNGGIILNHDVLSKIRLESEKVVNETKSKVYISYDECEFKEVLKKGSLRNHDEMNMPYNEVLEKRGHKATFKSSKDIKHISSGDKQHIEFKRDLYNSKLLKDNIYYKITNYIFFAILAIIAIIIFIQVDKWGMRFMFMFGSFVLVAFAILGPSKWVFSKIKIPAWFHVEKNKYTYIEKDDKGKTFKMELKANEIEEIISGESLFLVSDKKINVIRFSDNKLCKKIHNAINFMITNTNQ